MHINRLMLNSLLVALGVVWNLHGQEKITVPPTPVEREHKTQEQIRREWTGLTTKTREDAIAALKLTQRNNGAWVTLTDYWGEEVSPLVIEALLESGVPLSDPVIVKGLKNLRGYRPELTNVVAMQTIVLCKANCKRDHSVIERNVEWLLKGVRRNGDGFLGWGRIQDDATRPHDAYNFYAVMALRSARQVGIDCGPKIWREIRDFYISKQKNDGGWTWIPQMDSPTARMPTVIALYALHVANEQLSWSWTSGRAENAIAKGVDWLTESGSMTDDEAVFFLYALIRLGEFQGEWTFANNPNKKKRDWFEDGVIWIVNNRTPSGTIFVARADTTKTTASALLFLAAGK